MSGEFIIFVEYANGTFAGTFSFGVPTTHTSVTKWHFLEWKSCSLCQGNVSKWMKVELLRNKS